MTKYFQINSSYISYINIHLGKLLIFKRFSANGSQWNYKHNQVTDNRMIPYLNMIVLAAIVTRKSCLKSFNVESVTQLRAQ